MLFTASPQTRLANHEDEQRLKVFLDRSWNQHIHLDWRAPESWAKSGNCAVLEIEGCLAAVLAIPILPIEPAWIRVFAVDYSLSLAKAWNALFPLLREGLQKAGSPPLCAVALRSWSIEYFQQARFIHIQDIVTFELGRPVSPGRPVPGLRILPMSIEHVEAVAAIDQAAFESIWRNNSESVLQAFLHSAYATIAECDGQIVGFQISTENISSGHLARLAVSPGCQRSGVGSALVRDLVQQFFARGKKVVTVNTQSTNQTSQKLYQNLGFEFTGSRYPVFIQETY